MKYHVLHLFFFIFVLLLWFLLVWSFWIFIITIVISIIFIKRKHLTLEEIWILSNTRFWYKLWISIKLNVNVMIRHSLSNELFPNSFNITLIFFMISCRYLKHIENDCNLITWWNVLIRYEYWLLLLSYLIQDLWR